MMDLQLRLYCTRLISVFVEVTAIIFVSIAIARLLGGSEAFGLYSVFISSVFLGNYVLTLGQDRLLLVLLSQFKKQSSSENEKEYLFFISCFVLFYLLILIVSVVCFFCIPNYTPHPLLLGLCFSPFFALYEISKNMLNVAGYPVLARYIFIGVLMFLVIPVLFAYRHYVGMVSYVEIAYVMMFFLMMAGSLNFLLSIFYFRVFDKESSINDFQMTEGIQGNYFSKIYLSFMGVIFLLRHNKLDKKHMNEWVRKGVPIGLSTLNDYVYDLIIPLLYLSHISLSAIALLSVAKRLRGYLGYVSLVIRNHFIPSLVSLFADNESLPEVSAIVRKKIRAVNRVIWITCIVLVAMLIVAAPYILKVYGDEYSGAYPMLVIMLVLSFFVQGWAFHRGLMISFNDLRQLLLKTQLMRFVVIMVLSSLSGFWFGNVYLVILSVGVPSLICCLIQLYAFYRKTKVFLICP